MLSCKNCQDVKITYFNNNNNNNNNNKNNSIYTAFKTGAKPVSITKICKSDCFIAGPE